jgi:hypothetical protein
LTFTIIVIVQANPTEKINGAQQNHGPTTNLRHVKFVTPQNIILGNLGKKIF